MTRASHPAPGIPEVGRGLWFLAANRPARILFPGLTEMAPAQVIELWFGEGPFRERVAN